MVEQVRKEQQTKVAEMESKIPTIVADELRKELQIQTNEAKRFRIPYNQNSNVNPDHKPGADVTFGVLRRMAQLYPIARACINRRIRQITQLEWDIKLKDEINSTQNKYKGQIDTLKAFFEKPMGARTRMRELLTLMVDDILTIDATSFEIRRTRGGEFINLVPIDPSTIVLRLDDTGATPEPPDIAYVQYIFGQKTASFTTQEMIYECMNTRSYSAYGMAPLESLIMQAEAALRGILYNLSYFREGNVPEGFIELPEDIASTQQQVEQWQQWFDLIVAGDPRMMHRLKIMPGGAKYTPAKKPADMAFERFELWLLQQTCAMFDVPPQDIGITYQVNKATSETQQDLSREKGLQPLANFLKEIFDVLIAEEFGMPELQFIWQNLNPVDRKEEAEIADIEIRNGSLSVDEYRTQYLGKEPLGLGAYIMTRTGPVLVEDVINGQFNPSPNKNAGPLSPENVDEDPSAYGDDSESTGSEQATPKKTENSELKAWRKAVYRDLEMGRPLRTKFPSEYISPQIHENISKVLKSVKNKFQARVVFDQYLDPEIKASLKLLEHSSALRKMEKDANQTPAA